MRTASRSHKSQGATVDKVIVNSEASTHRSNFNEFYVQATRQKFDISIYTDSKDRLKEQVRHEQDKASTLDTYGEARVDFSKYERAMAENRNHILRMIKNHTWKGKRSPRTERRTHQRIV